MAKLTHKDPFHTAKCISHLDFAVIKEIAHDRKASGANETSESIYDGADVNMKRVYDGVHTTLQPAPNKNLFSSKNCAYILHY